MKTKWYDTRALFELNQFVHPDSMAVALIFAGLFGVLASLVLVAHTNIAFIPLGIAVFLGTLSALCVLVLILMIVTYAVTSKMIESIHYP